MNIEKMNNILIMTVKMFSYCEALVNRIYDSVYTLIWGDYKNKITNIIFITEDGERHFYNYDNTYNTSLLREIEIQYNLNGKAYIIVLPIDPSKNIIFPLPANYGDEEMVFNNIFSTIITDWRGQEYDGTYMVEKAAGAKGDFYREFGLDLKVDYLVPEDLKRSFESIEIETLTKKKNYYERDVIIDMGDDEDYFAESDDDI